MDWGPKGNMEEYGQATPPPYNLTTVTAPVTLFWGENDWLATPKVTKFRLQSFNLNFLKIHLKFSLRTSRGWPNDWATCRASTGSISANSITSTSCGPPMSTNCSTTRCSSSCPPITERSPAPKSWIKLSQHVKSQLCHQVPWKRPRFYVSNGPIHLKLKKNFFFLKIPPLRPSSGRRSNYVLPGKKTFLARLQVANNKRNCRVTMQRERSPKKANESNKTSAAAPKMEAMCAPKKINFDFCSGTRNL